MLVKIIADLEHTGITWAFIIRAWVLLYIALLPLIVFNVGGLRQKAGLIQFHVFLLAMALY